LKEIPVFCVGLDLGQRRDYTAIAIVERRYKDDEQRTLHNLALRRIERVPLGTSYPQVVERVRAIVQHPVLRGKCSLTVDATGVGNPVVDMLGAARLGCDINAVTITGAERGQQNSNSGLGSGGITRWSVPKRDLIAGLEVLLERGELRIARRLKDVGSLIKELMDMRSSTSATGKIRIGAEAHGEHDDLVIALALACWRAKRPVNGPVPGLRLWY
jgi:hypothetical protein